MVQVGSQRYRRIFLNKIHILFYGQIWLNLPMEYYHFGHIKKIDQKKIK
jgi:hypothetical protein